MAKPFLEELPISYLGRQKSKELDFAIYNENGKELYPKGTVLSEELLAEIEGSGQKLFKRNVKGRSIFDQAKLAEMTEQTSEMFEEIRKSGVLRSTTFVESRRQYDRVLQGLDQEAINEGYIELGSTMSELDDYSYRHAVNTGSLALIFGTKLRIPREELLDLVQSAYYFDIGLTRVPKDLLQKIQHLDAKERKLLEDHTSLGYRILNEFSARNPELTSAINAKLTALTHHVKYNGKGYPATMKVKGQNVKLNYSHIPQFARMTSICDLFCALTEERPHRKGMENQKALRTILNESLNSYDTKLVHDFLNHMGLSLNYNEPFYKRFDVVVLLSSQKSGRQMIHENELAIVEQTHERNLMRPVVNLVYNTNKKRKLNRIQVDLRRDHSRKMIRLVDTPDLVEKVRAMAS